MTQVALATEDILSEAIGLRLLSELPIPVTPNPLLRKDGFGYLRSRMDSWRQLAQRQIVLIITDLDQAACPIALRTNWLGTKPLPANLILRIAVRETEAWILADHEAMRNLIGKKGALPPAPDDLPDDFVAQTLRQQVRSSPMSEVAPSPKRYKTTNWPQYNAALKARGSLTLWLDSDMQWLAAPSGKRGRQHLFSDACIQFCLSMKCLFGLPLRQTLGLVQSLLQLSGAHWPVPDYSTVSRRQKSLTVELNYQRSGEGLHLLVDSTGIKFLGEGEWKCKKHGPEYRRQWRKVHLGIDAQTLEIRAIEVTDNSIGDAPMLPCLLEQIAEQEDLLSVSADGAYDTKACHEAIAQRGAQAIIPPRKNAKWWKEGKSAGAKVRNEAVKACQRLGHRLWKQWSGYHRRSLVETKMHCFKRLGERVMARTFERQVVELQVRVALLNRFTQLGRPVTVPVA